MIDSRMQNIILEEMISKLDIPDSTYEKAVSRYTDLGDWFDREGSSISKYSPHIFPQGSFCLGTAIRPLNDSSEYDLDLSCELRTGVTTENCTQEQLRDIVQKELEQYCKARHIANKIELKHRCLRIPYQDELRFHMDIVPCIPSSRKVQHNIMDSLIKYGSDNGFAQNVSESTIYITDDRLSSFKLLCDDWKISNPEGYANWFKSRMELGSKHVLLEKAAQVEDIPIYKRKVPLQRVIQLLKRHRDVMFSRNEDSKPISILLTTLAGQSYSGEQDIASTVINILNRMGTFINNVVPLVPNPVDPNEDFADKWRMNEYDSLRLEQNFRLWLAQAKTDFRTLFLTFDKELITDLTESRFGIEIDRQILAEQARKMAVNESTFKPTEHTIAGQPAKPWQFDQRR